MAPLLQPADSESWCGGATRVAASHHRPVHSRNAGCDDPPGEKTIDHNLHHQPDLGGGPMPGGGGSREGG